MGYLEIILPVIFFTALLIFSSNFSLFNTYGRKFKNSEADIFLKGILGLELVVLIIIAIFLM